VSVWLFSSEEYHFDLGSTGALSDQFRAHLLTEHFEIPSLTERYLTTMTKENWKGLEEGTCAFL